MKHKHHKRILPMALAAAMVVPAVPAFAEDTISPLTSANPTGNVPVELSQAATRFSVSVPTVLPVDVDKDGNVTTASDNRIVNHSFGPVEVKDIIVEPLSDWKLYDFNTDFSKEKVGHSFGFHVNGNDVSAADGKCAVDNFPVLKGGCEDELTFTYDANMATQRKAISGEQIANVVFKMGWSGQSIKGYEIVPLEDIIYSNDIALLNIGESVNLTAVAMYSSESDKTEWTSSDESVLTVTSDGFAQAKSIGTATVTYTNTESGVSGSLDFVVTKKYGTNIVGRWISGDTICTLYNNGTFVVSGNGAMADYSSHTQQPWYSKRHLIKTITFESGVTSVGACSIKDNGCDTLEPTSVTFCNTLKTIGYYASYGHEYVRSIVIPDGVTTIGYGAFGNCDKLTSITVPQSVQTLGSYCFHNQGDNNYNYLNIYYSGTMEQWKTLMSTTSNIVDTSMDVRVYCSDGTLRY